MKKHLFAFAFVASSLVFSCGQQDQVAPVVAPQKSSARTADTCVQPTNNVSIGYYYWNGEPSPVSISVNGAGRVFFSTHYGDQYYQYFNVLAKLDKMSGSGTYSESWRECFRVDETTYPIYQTSSIEWGSIDPIPATGSTYRLTLQYRAFVSSSTDCYSPEKVFTYDFVR